MPELPEVETVKNVLKKSILNKKINSIEIIYPKIIDLGDINSLINEEFININRRGKFLIFETNNHYLVSHLRMEGKYFIKDNNLPIEKHEHIIFRFNDFSLRYHDTRKFGRMEIVNKNDLNKTPINNLGVDPIIDKINIKEIYPKFNKKMPIKTLLLDQSIICGIGNIYVDEVLFLSKIDPNRLGNTIKLNELELIVKNTIKVLKESIKLGGCTIRSYTSSLGVIGHYQDKLLVHTKEYCTCGNKITKTRINGRGTYYCSKCQL